MTTIYLALGSNVGDSTAYIKQAAELLRPLLSDLKQAPLYLSEAVGHTDQSNFYNTAVSGNTGLPPTAFLAYLKAIERKIGRTPTFHHGPREIDIDIIFYGDLKLETATLTIPHPDFVNRDFVLQPLLDLNPELIDPQSGQTVAALLGKLQPEQRSIIRRVDAGS
jgi:2-amino-4-hydroxy-6-hydroxymethyldihydropteridine diphosphokinase